jgi:adenylate cyclase
MSEPTQRKLAAIVSADVAGYSRLVGRDELGTLARLRAHRSELIDPLIARHGGRVVKTKGDGLLLEFPSVVAAVECALGVQSQMPARNQGLGDDAAMQFRVGVHLGDVVIDGTDLLGDGVNVASRIEALAEVGGVAISDDAHRQVRDRLDTRWRDGGAQSVKNIDRPIQIWHYAAEEPSEPKAAATTSSSTQKPSIAVLPFENMSGDPEQEYFADGIAEDIITGLSRFRSFQVIARNTTFTFKGRNVNVADVSRQLNARYVVEGSVRKSGTRVRVTAQLIDGETNAHLWADRYDGVLEDVFDLQDEVTQAIVAAIAPQSVIAEVARATRMEGNDLGAWDLLMRARWHMGRYNPQDAARARDLFQQVTKNNPRDAQAFAWLAILGVVEASWGWASDQKATAIACIADAKRAESLDRSDPQVMAAVGVALLMERQFERAEEISLRAVNGNPNLAFAHGTRAAVLGLSGKYEEGMAAVEAMRRLSPLDPELSLVISAVSLGACTVGRYEDVLRHCDEMFAINPEMPAIFRQRAVAFIELGRPDDAEEAVETLLRMAPGITLKGVMDTLPCPPEAVARHVEALRKAGLPE